MKPLKFYATINVFLECHIITTNKPLRFLYLDTIKNPSFEHREGWHLHDRHWREARQVIFEAACITELRGSIHVLRRDHTRKRTREHILQRYTANDNDAEKSIISANIIHRTIVTLTTTEYFISMA